MRLRPLIAGNWKMFGRRADLAVVDAVAVVAAKAAGSVEVALCPPFTLLGEAVKRAGGSLAIGAQDCRADGDGAYTGDINAAMVADLGCTFVIVGHSERRQGWGETDAVVRDKARAAQAVGLIPIICVGETLEERQAGRADTIVEAQIRGSLPEGAEAAGVVIAYEPVWAIGTGLTPTVSEIAQVHAAAKAALPEGVRVLYGGSVKPANAAEILAVEGVDGALVGGASLKAADFAAIITAHPDLSDW